MYDPRRVTVVGNCMINGPSLVSFLKKSHYFLTYDDETHTITLNANHFTGGVVLFKIMNASYENAVKLAKELGLKGNGDNPGLWSKYNPVVMLHHNRSEEAETLRIELLKLDIPHICRYFQQSAPWSYTDYRGMHGPPMWTVDKILDIIRTDAKNWEQALNSTP